MNNLKDIQSQIAKLQKQADLIKRKEFAQTVQDIKDKMQAFGITVDDLQTGKLARRTKVTTPAVKTNQITGSRKPNKLVGAKVAAKYRNASGEGWSGRGLMPRWLKSAIAEGHTKEEFLIE